VKFENLSERIGDLVKILSQFMILISAYGIFGSSIVVIGLYF